MSDGGGGFSIDSDQQPSNVDGGVLNNAVFNNAALPSIPVFPFSDEVTFRAPANTASLMVGAMVAGVVLLAVAKRR